MRSGVLAIRSEQTGGGPPVGRLQGPTPVCDGMTEAQASGGRRAGRMPFWVLALPLLRQVTSGGPQNPGLRKDTQAVRPDTPVRGCCASEPFEPLVG